MGELAAGYAARSGHIIDQQVAIDVAVLERVPRSGVNRNAPLVLGSSGQEADLPAMQALNLRGEGVQEVGAGIEALAVRGITHQPVAAAIALQLQNRALFKRKAYARTTRVASRGFDRLGGDSRRTRRLPHGIPR